MLLKNVVIMELLLTQFNYSTLYDIQASDLLIINNKCMSEFILEDILVFSIFLIGILQIWEML